MDDMYMIEIRVIDEKGKIKTHRKETKARNDLQAIDKAYNEYKNNNKDKEILDIKVV